MNNFATTPQPPMSRRWTFIGAAVVFAVFMVTSLVALTWWRDAEASSASTASIGSFLAMVVWGWSAVPAVVTAVALAFHRLMPRAAWWMVVASLCWFAAGALFAAQKFIPV